MLIQIIFQYLNEASSVFFMVVLMQCIKQQIIFFLPLLITRLMLAIYLCLIVDIMIMNDIMIMVFLLFESSGFEFKVVLKII